MPRTPARDAGETTRMSAARRRELVLDAAVHTFSSNGYAGTSTDAVARQAGVSQPYIVRIFGSKLELFLAVFDRVMTRIGRAFADELARVPFDPDDEDDWSRLRLVYTELMVDRDLLMVMMHGILAGSTPEIGARARECVGTLYAVLKDTGCTDERVTEFVAQGMLLNVMLAMRTPEHLGDEPALTSLALCAFGDAITALT